MRRIVVLATLVLLACSEEAVDRDAAPDTAASDTTATGDQGAAPDEGLVTSDKGTPVDKGSPPDTTTTGKPALCPAPLPKTWIFCEDFEQTTSPASVFFEYNTNSGDFKRVSTEGASGTHSMEVLWQKGEVGAGWISVAFGRNPIVYSGKPHYRKSEDFTEIYWRLRVKHQAGWPDVGPAKLTRATAFAKSNWGQAMIAHLWSSGVVLLGDPATCVSGSTVSCNTYNDFANLKWLGQMKGTTKIFSKAESGKWRCVEGHVKLNTLGAKDGVFRFWIDGKLESGRSDLDWRGSWSQYGINLVSIENYWNSGATQQLKRWIDDIAIATVRVGCK